MATFRLFVALSKQLKLTVYQGDVNTAYRNAVLGIKQYLEDLDGYPCDEAGMAYVIDKALYGLKQSGREWNTEVNSWFLRCGFKQCSTEPCLYFYEHDGVFAIVLLYVDDILCATKDEGFKKKMFEQLNKDYGIKYHGLLSTYLGVEIEQNEKSIKIHQTQYCEHVLEKFGFNEAHASRIPMETTLRLIVEDTDNAPRKQEPHNSKKFSYRELIGTLMVPRAASFLHLPRKAPPSSNHP
ncbi:Integrase, catalytic core protein [Phytophthora cinnamomi]|uniref:Integrase, catalytic core protein n=1 Tax=Phytophthora cinnamomi TaxID=4785 RepID=UPI0035599A69|nr:Integrase, catalytic core protein [Phytophthora cinnamomi]